MPSKAIKALYKSKVRKPRPTESAVSTRQTARKRAKKKGRRS